MFALSYIPARWIFGVLLCCVVVTGTASQSTARDAHDIPLIPRSTENLPVIAIGTLHRTGETGTTFTSYLPLTPASPGLQPEATTVWAKAATVAMETKGYSRISPVSLTPPPIRTATAAHPIEVEILEFRVQESIKGGLSGNYRILLDSTPTFDTSWQADFQDGRKVVLFATRLSKNRVYEKPLILPRVGIWGSYGIHEDLTVDTVEEATRGLVALDRAKNAEAAHTVLRKMLTSPIPLVRYTACFAPATKTTMDVLPGQHDRYVVSLVHAIPLLNDPNEFVRICANYRITDALPHSASFVASIHLLNTTKSPPLLKKVYQRIETYFFRTTPIISPPDYLRSITGSYGERGYKPEWYTEHAPELSALLTDWWSQNNSRMLVAHGGTLIPLLTSDSQVARWHAIKLLTEMAGTDYGFDPDASEEKRVAAVARWQVWLKELKKQAAHAPPIPAYLYSSP